MSQAPESSWQTIAAIWYERFAVDISNTLKRKFPNADPVDANDAFVNGLLEIAKKADAIDPERGPGPLLMKAAVCRMKDIQDSKTARKRRDEEKGKILVAQQAAAAKNVADWLADKEIFEEARKLVCDNEDELTVLDCWALGMDDAAIAHKLDLAHLHEDERRAHVKKLRDRVTQRLRRLKGRFENAGDE